MDGTMAENLGRTAGQRVPNGLPTVPDFINEASQADWYRVGIQYGQRLFEVTGLELGTLTPSGSALVDFAATRAALLALVPANDLAYDEVPTAGPQRRLVEAQEQLFHNEALTGPLDAGHVTSLALPYESYRLALTPGLVSEVATGASALTQTTVSPAELEALLTGDGAYVERGGAHWAPSGRVIFDAAHFYLPVRAIDPFGEEYRVEYDSYSLLIIETRDPLDNVVVAEHDYRVLQPWRVTDPNLNRTAVAFDALGMVARTAVMGKDGAGEGDTLDDPTATLEYDLHRWRNEGRPAFVKTTAREQHGLTNPRWQESYAYSDGFGRVVMQKVQAEPGDAPLRNPDGSLQRNPDGSLVVDYVAARWVGTGRTVFNNKGNPVRQYEPFFSATSDYEDEADLVEWGVTPVLHYDPRDRVVRTDLPDGTFSRVEFDAWKQTSFDANDTVLESDWYTERGSPLPAAPEPTDPDERAAWLATQHANTPSITHLDTLGRAFLAQVTNRLDGADVLYDTHTTLDIEGQPLVITDALGHHTITQRFDVAGRRLRVDSLEGGTRLTLPDVAGKPLRTWDARQQVTRAKYDALQRPTHLFVAVGATERLLQRTVYGESLALATAQAANLCGQAHRVYDGAGVVTSVAFDFKGNLLQASRRLATDYLVEPDWVATDLLTDPAAIAAAAEPLLEAETWTSSTAYDALNRVVTATTPDGSVTRPVYNEANLLDAVHVSVRGDPEAPVLTNLGYNARGQRTLAEHANGTSVVYTYDERTFRLKTLVTTRASDGVRLQDLRYFYDPVGNICELHDRASTVPLFTGPAPVSSDGKYAYDSLYRLVEAQGREHPGQTQPGPVDLAIGPLPHPNDLQALARYTERYTYDAVGNIERMQHLPAAGSPVPGWTRRYRYAYQVTGELASNRLLATSIPGDPDGTFSETYEYRDDATNTAGAHGSMTRMPHLPGGLDWDHADRMKRAGKLGGGDTYFTYDGAGQRVRKVYVHSGLVEERIYLGGYELYRQRAAAPGAPIDEERQTLHVMDDQRRVAMAETKTVTDRVPDAAPTTRWRFELDNHLGSAMLEVDQAGNVITYEEYHPYGTTAFHTADGAAEVSAKRYRYTGKEKDEETGLYYHGARYYAAWLGRWTAADPAGVVDGTCLYAYVRNEPTNLVDASGTQAGWWDPQARFQQLEEAAREVGAAAQQAISDTGEAVASAAQSAGEAIVGFGRGVAHAMADAAQAENLQKLHELKRNNELLGVGTANVDRVIERAEETTKYYEPQTTSEAVGYSAGPVLVGAATAYAVGRVSGARGGSARTPAPRSAPTGRGAPAAAPVRPPPSAPATPPGRAPATAPAVDARTPAPAAGAATDAARGGLGPVRQGAAGVERAVADLEAAGGRVLGREVTIEAGGVRTRPDLFAELPSGQQAFLEIKTGASAGLTPNQTAAFPQIWTQGGVPRGANAAAAGLTPGVPIGPTPVWTVHYPWPLP